MTKEIEECLPPIYSQEKSRDPKVCVKYFHPLSGWEWYGIEYNPEEKLFFGYVAGHECELGYFSLDELETIGDRKGLPIERDLYWDERNLSDVKEELKIRRRCR